MEDIISSVTNSKKRARDEPDFNSHESDRVDSGNSDANSPESKRVREDLLDTLEDADPETQDLDSVIKSFEYEILNQSAGEESQPEFGYLFKASDDELGLPPTMSASDDRKNSESTDLGPTMPHLGFDDDDIPSYDSFGFGIVGETEEWNSEFVTLGGLFEYSDGSDFLLRPDSWTTL